MTIIHVRLCFSGAQVNPVPQRSSFLRGRDTGTTLSFAYEMKTEEK